MRVMERYRLDDPVESGGFGTVFRGFDELLKRPVAVKILHDSAKGSPTLQSSLREARAASALNHPSIVTVHDVGEHEGRPFIVMEWVEGKTLRQILSGKRVDPVLVADCARQMASALAAAHAAGLVHRDLKPENVVLRDDGILKILDFGLALVHRHETSSERETLQQGLAGTIPYMAPEQFCEGPLSAACDAFALGIILYEMTTGRHPFLAPSPQATMHRILSADPEPPSAFADTPSAWDALLFGLLEKDPARRSTMSDLLTVLRSGLREASISTGRRGPENTRIVGRDRELACLRERWAMAGSGGGNFVLFAAEPGAGKTTLIQSFTRELLSEATALVASGRCTERLGSGEAYLPFLETLAELGNSNRGALVRTILRNRAPTWFVQLFPATSSDASFQQIHRELTGGSQERMRRELADALTELGRSYAICLLLDDLHWSDLATTELLAYLSKRMNGLRLLVIGTYRPAELLSGNHPLRSILLDMQASGVAMEAPLELLREEDIRAYLNLEFPGNRFPKEFGAWILQKTEGNALFMVDLLRYLAERKAIVLAAHWELVRSVEELQGEIPTSVMALIERILQMLSEDERRLLTVASVQGDSFDSLTLSRVTDTDELEVDEQLERLHRVHRLVSPVGEKELPGGNLTVVHKFVHVLYQEVLYEGLTAKRKIHFHDRIGRELESQYGDRSTQIAAELALHFDRARRPAVAASYYLRASENAVARFAHPQAVGYCDRAAALAQNLSEGDRDALLQAVLLSRGKARFTMSQFQEARSDFHAMLSCAERRKDADGQAHALCLLAEGSFFMKENEKLEEQVQRVLEIASMHDLPGRASNATCLLGLHRNCYGRIDEAAEMLQRSDRDAARAGFGAVRARARAWLTQLWFFRSEYERVLANSALCEALAIEHHDAFVLLVNYFYTGLAQANFGQLREAVRSLEQGVRAAERNHDLFWLGRYPNCIGWACHEALDFERALRVNGEAISIARQTGFLEGEANSKINVGLDCLALDELGRAEKSFAEAEDVFLRDDWYKWRYRLRLEIGWSELHLRRNNLVESRAHARKCLELAKRAYAPKYVALAHLQMGNVARKKEQMADAEKHLAAAVESTRDLRLPVVTWKVHLALGDLYQTTRRSDEARASFTTALEILNHLSDNAGDSERKSILESKVMRDLTRRLDSPGARRASP